MYKIYSSLKDIMFILSAMVGICKSNRYVYYNTDWLGFKHSQHNLTFNTKVEHYLQ